MKIKDKKLSSTTSRIELKNIDEILSVRDGYGEYKRDAELASNYKYISHPMYVVIEVNNYCNMRCKMCVKSLHENANGKDSMDMQLFKKLVNDGADCNLPSYFLGGSTECTINPNIRQIIKLIKEKGTGIDDVLITNGYELTEELSQLLVDLQWEKVFVSLDAATPEVYKKIRGKNLEVVENNINKLIEIREKCNSKFPIIRVSFVVQDENRKEKELFFDKWKDKVEIIDYQSLMHNEDLTIVEGLPDIDYKCTAPFNLLMVGCDGEIYPCCTEWSKAMPIGNISNMSLKEAWDSDKMKELRNSIINGKLNDVCKNCLKNTES